MLPSGRKYCLIKYQLFVQKKRHIVIIMSYCHNDVKIYFIYLNAHNYTLIYSIFQPDWSKMAKKRMPLYRIIGISRDFLVHQLAKYKYFSMKPSLFV